MENPDHQDKRGESPGQFGVAGCNAPEVLQLAEEPLDSVASLVSFTVQWPLDLSVRFRGNSGDTAILFDRSNGFLGVVSFVRCDTLGWNRFEKLACLGAVIHIAPSQREVDHPLQCFDDSVFVVRPPREQPIAWSPSDFLAPLAC